MFYTFGYEREASPSAVPEIEKGIKTLRAPLLLLWRAAQVLGCPYYIYWTFMVSSGGVNTTQHANILFFISSILLKLMVLFSGQDWSPLLFVGTHQVISTVCYIGGTRSSVKIKKHRTLPGLWYVRGNWIASLGDICLESSTSQILFWLGSALLSFAINSDHMW